MRRVLIFVTMAGFWCSLISIGMAQDTKATKSPEGKKVETKAAADTQTPGMNCPMGGQGMGYGRGAGGGMGMGYGRGAGGGGMGKGTGAGQGAGYGWGGGRGMGMGMGPGAGMGYRHGAGKGAGGGGGAFVDENKNGTCDNYESRNGTNK
jgi:hypothetical protein